MTPAPSEDSGHFQFQTKMLHELIEFYLDMNKLFKKHSSEQGQLVTLNFLIETLIVAGGSEAKVNQVVVLNIS